MHKNVDIIILMWYTDVNKNNKMSTKWNLLFLLVTIQADQEAV